MVPKLKAPLSQYANERAEAGETFTQQYKRLKVNSLSYYNWLRANPNIYVTADDKLVTVRPLAEGYSEWA